MSIEEKRSLKLRWKDVTQIVADEIENIIGIRATCKARPIQWDYWDFSFEDFRVPINKFYQLLQSTGASIEAWKDALPDEGMVDVGNTGMELAELLLGRHLHIAWEDRLITDDCLWLVGLTAGKAPSDTEDQDLSKLLGKWLDATADLLHNIAEDCMGMWEI